MKAHCPSRECSGSVSGIWEDVFKSTCFHIKTKWPKQQTFLAVFEDKGLRSALQHGQVVVRRLACLLACTVSSHGEAVALRLLLWLLSLL